MLHHFIASLIPTKTVADVDHQRVMSHVPEQGIEGDIELAGIGLTTHLELGIRTLESLEDIKNSLTTASGREVMAILIIEDQGAHAVTFTQHSPGCQGGQLRRYCRLHGPFAAKEHTDPLVDHQIDPTLSLFGVDADVRFSSTIGDLPIHGANVIARSVVPQFLEVEASPSEP